jgi:hypothetical protein
MKVTAAAVCAAALLVHQPSSARADECSQVDRYYQKPAQTSAYWEKTFTRLVGEVSRAIDRKNWSSAKLMLRQRGKKFCEACYKSTPNHAICGKWMPQFLELDKRVEQGQVAQIAKRACPQGNRPDPAMEKLLRSAYAIEHRDLMKGTDLKALRFDGTRAERIDGIAHELLDFVVCYRVKARTAEPKCRFQYLTYKRYRSGRAWSKPAAYAATTEGSGGAGDFPCANMK